MPKRFPTKTLNGKTNPSDLGDDSSTSETMDVTLSDEDAQLRAKNDKPWPPSIVEQLELNPL